MADAVACISRKSQSREIRKNQPSVIAGLCTAITLKLACHTSAATLDWDCNGAGTTGNPPNACAGGGDNHAKGAPDNDGIENLLEYTLDGNPVTPDAGIRQSFQSELRHCRAADFLDPFRQPGLLALMRPDRPGPGRVPR